MFRGKALWGWFTLNITGAGILDDEVKIKSNDYYAGCSSLVYTPDIIAYVVWQLHSEKIKFLRQKDGTLRLGLGILNEFPL